MFAFRGFILPDLVSSPTRLPLYSFCSVGTTLLNRSSCILLPKKYYGVENISSDNNNNNNIQSNPLNSEKKPYEDLRHTKDRLAEKRDIFGKYDADNEKNDTKKEDIEIVSLDSGPTKRTKAVLKEILSLSMIEMMQLINELKVILGPIITEARGFNPAQSQSSQPVQQAAAATSTDSTPPPTEKVATVSSKIFDVKITGYDTLSKIKIMKAIRSLEPGLSLTDTRTRMDNPPVVSVADVAEDVAMKWKTALEEAGAKVEVTSK